MKPIMGSFDVSSFDSYASHEICFLKEVTVDDFVIFSPPILARLIVKVLNQ
jgi:hypothetical protein